MTSTVPAVQTAARRSQLVRALRSVDEALEKLEERGEVIGLDRLREDLRSALRLTDHGRG